MELLDEHVSAALSRVYDPCSVAAGRPTSLIDMGLVTGWTVEDGILTVTCCVTFPGCTMAPHFAQAAREELLMIAGVANVVVTIDTGHVWTPAATVPMHGRPQEWRTRITP